MGFWSIVVPETTTNYAQNPSFEDNITDDWTSSDLGVGAVFTHSSTHAKYGAYSGQITAGNGEARYVQDTFSLANNSSLYASVWIWTDGGADDAQINIRDTTTPANRANTNNTTGSAWELLETYWTNTTGGAVNVRLELKNLAADSATNVWFDGAQAEIDTSDYTTYCDGTQSGCEWNGASHNSTSTRSALSRAGGVVYDLTDDYGFYVTGFLDTGVAPLTQHLDEYAIIPGGEISSYKVHPRVLTLQGTMISRVSFATLHDQIQALYDILKPDAVPNNQPILLRYTEATVTKEIAVRYEGGLGENWRGENCAKQNMALRFVAADPFWYEIGESSTVIDTNDTATLRYFAARLRSTGQWDDLGLTNNPTANGQIHSILVASDKSVYIGGNYDGLNNDTPAGSDYVIRFDPTDESFNLLVGASDVNGQVSVIVEGPDGTIYLGGSFTAVNGVATADYVVSYDPSTDTWASLADPDSGTAAITTVDAMAFDSEGNLFVGGNFTNFGGDADADYVAMWDGTSWTTPGGGATGGTGAVVAIAIDESDNVYVGGAFLNWNGDGDADCLAWWNGTAWAAVNDTAFGNTVLSLYYDRVLSLLYIGGYFTDAGGDANADYLAVWNGQAFTPLGDIIVGTGGAPGVTEIIRAPDGRIYIGGTGLVSAGDLTLTDNLACWNGSSWSPLDVNLSGTPDISALAHGAADPIVNENYDLWIGFSTTGASYFSGDTTVTNAGTTDIYPYIVVTRAGGTAASLVQIRNETTGVELDFDYDLLDGETLTIDPRLGTVVSSFFGIRYYALLSGSDVGTFTLASGNNNITIFVDVGGAPTITAYLLWRNKYWSVD